MNLFYEVKTNDSYHNVKHILKEYFALSDRLLLKLKNSQKILLNGSVCSVNDSISKEDIVSFTLDFEEESSNVVPTKIDLTILYEDDSYLIVDKPAGIAVHPSMNNYDTSLSNGIRYYFNEIGLKKKIRPVNRLDKDTSGLVIFAKNEYIQECLARQMKAKTFEKKYLAILEGILSDKQGTINAPIARKVTSIIERCIDKHGSPSITHYQVVKEKEDLSIVKFLLETGRTHQIRVHSNFIGHPILGDTLYGTPSRLISRQALHCYYVSFIHPITKIRVNYTSKLPNDMERVIDLT